MTGSWAGPGEVLVRGPMLLRSYRDGTDPKTAGGWLPTGDGGRLAADGTLTVFGRMAEVIVTGGEKVWPAAVEQVLSGHPGIDQVAVWKRPDPEWGERVVAWVVPRDPSAPSGPRRAPRPGGGPPGPVGRPPRAGGGRLPAPDPERQGPPGGAAPDPPGPTRLIRPPRPRRQVMPPLAMHMAPPSMTRV